MHRLITAAVASATLAAPVMAQKVHVEEFKLDNGMEFLLVPRKEQPNSIAAGWLAKVGSANERPGITGISHFFEHMMFKGTSTIGTNDAAKDRDFNLKEKDVRDKLMDLQLNVQYQRFKNGEIDDPWDPKYDTPEMAKLRAELKDLMARQAKESTVKDEFDKVYTKFGGSQMNAFTENDVTFFFITVPSNKFELWAWMESDRLKDSVFREFYSERDVVHEERRLRTESTPTGRFEEQFDAMFWMSSPYHWPVIGWTSDLNSYTREQAEEYFNTYYRPNNLVGIIVGDFDPDYVKPLIKEYFGRLKRGPEPPKVVTLEMPQLAEQRMNAEGDVQPQIEVRYHAVPFGHADSYALQMMAEILNGRTGRLYKSMVDGKRIASDTSARLEAKKYAGAFSISAETKGDATPEQLEAAWYDVLADLQNNPVPEQELQKVKNRVAANSYRRLQNNFFLMIQLGLNEARGGWQHLNEDPQRLQAVTAGDIQRVAKEYFDKSNRSVATFTRTSGSAPEDPELAALEPQAKSFVKQQLATIRTITDVAVLRDAADRMSSRMSTAPEQFRPALKYLTAKIRERIDELNAAGGH